jgi:hypothetical protein
MHSSSYLAVTTWVTCLSSTATHALSNQTLPDGIMFPLLPHNQLPHNGSLVRQAGTD